MLPIHTIIDRIEMIIDAECGGKATVFAERLGINSANVSQWRSGSTKPRNQTIQQIADTFGYNRDWLATGEGEPRSLAAEDQQIIDFLTHAMKYKTTASDRLIRAVAVVSRTNPEVLDSAITFMQRLVDELSPPE